MEAGDIQFNASAPATPSSSAKPIALAINPARTPSIIHAARITVMMVCIPGERIPPKEVEAMIAARKTNTE